MNTVIYCFSGRGNSLAVARGLAERLEGAEVRPMRPGGALPDAERVGLVMPVIDLGIPAYVRRFITGLGASEPAPYVFAVVTCGGMPGGSMGQVRKLLGRRGLRLNAGWTVTFGLEPWNDAEWTGLLDGIAASVANGEAVPPPTVPAGPRLMTAAANPLARLIIPGEDRKFRVSSACTGCGTCAKVCPARNIEIRDGRPVWRHRCEQCAACFGWCPQMAIGGTCLAAHTRYINPRVKLNQILGMEGNA